MRKLINSVKTKAVCAAGVPEPHSVMKEETSTSLTA